MEKDKLLKAIKILIKKYREKNNEIILEPEFIEEMLFIPNEDGTKSINNDIFYILRENKIDMDGVSFKNVHIKKHQFNGFKNVEINIDEIPNKDLSETILEGVKLIGSLDGANVKQTSFNGYIGNLILNPQKVKDKNLYFTELEGITINGSFDDVFIACTDFRGAKGDIIINPEKIKDKRISQAHLEGVHFVGNYNEVSGNYDKACFDNCYLVGADFIGIKGQIQINPQKVMYKTMALCKGKNIVFTDTFDGINSENANFIDCIYHKPKVFLLEKKLV